jgi:hypothetical protein
MTAQKQVDARTGEPMNINLTDLSLKDWLFLQQLMREISGFCVKLRCHDCDEGRICPQEFNDDYL